MLMPLSGMEVYEKQTTSILALILLVLTISYVKGKHVIIEDDILVHVDEDAVHTLSYTIKTNTWDSGQIPFIIDQSLGQSRGSITNIRSAVYNIQQKTNNCIRFIPRTTIDEDYINITGANSGCYSSVGRIGGQQIVNIGPGCDSVGIIMHELLHALGFWHEQSRIDRKNYVDINYQNIITGRDSEFAIRDDSTGVVEAIPYDFYSILHYKYNQFAKSKTLDTIVPNAKHSDVAKTELGQRTQLSDKDIARIMWLYQCDTAPDFENVEASPKLLKYMSGARITFSCKAGTLIGAKMSECISSGYWSGAKPYCVQGNKKAFTFCDMGECLVDARGRPLWFMPRISGQVSKWQAFSGATPTEGTGPSTDHTSQTVTGKYLLTEATDVPGGQLAVALSPLVMIPSKGGHFKVCLMFYYYMFGSDLDSTSQLKVFILWQHGWSPSPVWSRSGQTEEAKWYKVFIDETKTTNNYAVVLFTAKRNKSGYKSDKSDIAIDDVFLGPCSEVKKYNVVCNDEESNEKPNEFD